MKTTLTANKRGLSPAVVAGYTPTSAASLTGLAGVNHNDLASSRFGLIFNKTLELSKAPGVESAAGLSMIDLDSISDVSEVFKNDSSTRFNIPDNRGGNNVVTIPSEALFAPSEASKMPFGTLRTIGLQITFKAKDKFDYFFLMTVPMKAVIGTDGRSCNPQINPDSLAIGYKFDIGQTDNDMKEKLTLVVNKISGGSFATDSIDGVRGNTKDNLHSTTGSRHTDDVLIPVHLEGMKVVSGRTNKRLGASNLVSFLLKRQGRLNRLGGLLSGLYMQIGDQIRQSVLTVTVGEFMKSIGITGSLFIAYLTDCVKRLGKLMHRFMQSLGLLVIRFKLNLYRSIHPYIIPYKVNILQGGSDNSPAT